MECWEKKPRNLGGSLPVPNVQDLAARPDHLTPTLLRRYLRPHHLPLPADDHHAMAMIAVLSHACEEWGFFQVINHGIADETVEEMKRDVMAAELLRAMARNLGLRDADQMTRLAAAHELLPAMPGKGDQGQGPGRVAALGRCCCSPVKGLQIRRGDAWIPVDPIPGALVANVGEMVTNGRYKSIEHRVVVDAAQERVSVAAFHTATFGSRYGPLEEMVGGGEARYRSISVEDYVRLVVSSKLQSKNILYFVGQTDGEGKRDKARA
uniref:Fe2OG dioxygenase domain-containing protein n=1 Tax=Oryza meridionalis TaxID=40149 RepID=A0A0E0D9R1_9ORYZ